MSSPTSDSSPTSSSPTTSPRLQLTVFLPASELMPNLADLIEIDRTLYAHWALYVGDGDVVHIVGEDDQDLPDDEEAVVKLTSLTSLGGDSFMRVNNKEVPAKERSLVPIDADKVVAKALSMVGSRVPYNFLTTNGEHYLTEWKFGQPWSDQASVAFTAIKTLRHDSVSSGHNILVSTLNEVLNTPGANILSSSPSSFSRSPSLSTSSSQTEPTHVN